MSQVGIFYRDNLVREVYPKDPEQDLSAATARAANGLPWMVTDTTLLPDYYFRSAWYWDGNSEHAVSIDMTEARVVQRSIIAQGIPAMQADLEAQLAAAIAAGNAPLVAELEAKLAKLASILQDTRIDAAETPEALKLLTLQYLMDN